MHILGAAKLISEGPKKFGGKMTEIWGVLYLGENYLL